MSAQANNVNNLNKLNGENLQADENTEAFLSIDDTGTTKITGVTAGAADTASISSAVETPVLTEAQVSAAAAQAPGVDPVVTAVMEEVSVLFEGQETGEDGEVVFVEPGDPKITEVAENVDAILSEQTIEGNAAVSGLEEPLADSTIKLLVNTLNEPVEESPETKPGASSETSPGTETFLRRMRAVDTETAEKTDTTTQQVTSAGFITKSDSAGASETPQKAPEFNIGDSGRDAINGIDSGIVELEKAKESLIVRETKKVHSGYDQWGDPTYTTKIIEHNFSPEAEALMDESIELLDEIKDILNDSSLSSAEASEKTEAAWEKLNDTLAKLDEAISKINQAPWPIAKDYNKTNDDGWSFGNSAFFKGQLLKQKINGKLNAVKGVLELAVKRVKEEYINACLFDKLLKLDEVYPDTFSGDMRFTCNHVDYNLAKIKLEMMYGDVDKFKTSLGSGYQGISENRMQAMFKALSAWTNILRMMEMLSRSKYEAASLVHQEMTGIKGYEGMDVKGIIAKECAIAMKQSQMFMNNLIKAVKAHNERVYQAKIAEAKRRKKRGGWFKRLWRKLSGEAQKEYAKTMKNINNQFKKVTSAMLGQITAAMAATAVQDNKNKKNANDMFAMMETAEKEVLKDYAQKAAPHEIAEKEGVEGFLDDVKFWIGSKSADVDSPFYTQAGSGYWDIDLDAMVECRQRLLAMQNVQKMFISAYYSQKEARATIHQEMTGIGGPSSNKEVAVSVFSAQSKNRVKLFDRTSSLLIKKVQLHNEFNKWRNEWRRCCVSGAFSAVATVLDCVAMVLAFINPVAGMIVKGVADVIRSLGSLVADEFIQDDYQVQSMEAPGDTTDRLLKLKEKHRKSDYEAVQAAEYQQQLLLREMFLDTSLMVDPGDGSREVDSARIAEYRDRLVGIQNVIRMIRSVSKEKYSARSLVHKEMTGIGSAEGSELLDEALSATLLYTLTLFSAFTMELNEKVNAHNIGWMRQKRIHDAKRSFWYSFMPAGGSHYATKENEKNSPYGGYDVSLESSASFDQESSADPGTAQAALDRAENAAYTRLMNEGIGETGEGNVALNSAKLVECIDELRRIANIKDAFARVRKAMQDARNLIHLEMTGVGGRKSGDLTKKVMRAEFENSIQKFQLIVKFLQAKGKIQNRRVNARKAVDHAEIQFWLAWVPGIGPIVSTYLDLMWSYDEFNSNCGVLETDPDQYLREVADKGEMSALDRAEREALLTMCKDIIADTGFGYWGVDSGYYARAKDAMNKIYRVKNAFANVSASKAKTRAMMHRTMTGIGGYQADGGASVINMNKTYALSTLYTLYLRVQSITERHNQMNDARKQLIAASITLTVQLAQAAAGQSGGDIGTILKDMVIKIAQDQNLGGWGGFDKEAKYQESQFSNVNKAQGKGKGKGKAGNIDALEAQALADDVEAGRQAFQGERADRAFQSDSEWMDMVWKLIQALVKKAAAKSGGKGGKAGAGKSGGAGKGGKPGSVGGKKGMKQKLKGFLEKKMKKAMKKWKDTAGSWDSTKGVFKNILKILLKNLKDIVNKGLENVTDLDEIKVDLAELEPLMNEKTTADGGNPKQGDWQQRYDGTGSFDVKKDILKEQMDTMAEQIDNMQEEDAADQAQGAQPAQTTGQAETSANIPDTAKGDAGPPAAESKTPSKFEARMTLAGQNLKGVPGEVVKPFTEAPKTLGKIGWSGFIKAPVKAMKQLGTLVKDENISLLWKAPLFLFKYHMKDTLLHNIYRAVNKDKAEDLGKQEVTDVGNFYRKAFSLEPKTAYKGAPSAEVSKALTEAAVKELATATVAQDAKGIEKAIQALATINNTASDPKVVMDTAQAVMKTMGATADVIANVEKALSMEPAQVQEGTVSTDAAAKTTATAESLEVQLQKLKNPDGTPPTADQKVEFATKHIQARSEKITSNTKQLQPENVKTELAAVQKDMQTLAKLIKQTKPANKELAAAVNKVVKDNALSAKAPITAQTAAKVATEFQAVIQSAAGQGKPSPAMTKAITNLQNTTAELARTEIAQQAVQTAQTALSQISKPTPDMLSAVNTVSNNQKGSLEVINNMITSQQVKDPQTIKQIIILAEKFVASPDAQVSNSAVIVIGSANKALASPRSIAVSQPSALEKVNAEVNAVKLANGKAQLSESINYVKSINADSDPKVQYLSNKLQDISKDSTLTFNQKCESFSKTINNYMEANNLQKPEQGKKDVWQNAETTLTKGGDCEDIAIAKAACIQAFLGKQGQAAVVVTDQGSHAKVFASKTNSNTTIILDIPHTDNQVIASNLSTALASTDACFSEQTAPVINNADMQSGKTEILTSALAPATEITETVQPKAPKAEAKQAPPISRDARAKAETVITMLSKPKKAEEAVQMVINSKNKEEIKALVILIESQPEQQKSKLMTKLIQGVVAEANKASNNKSLTMTQMSLDALAEIKNASSNPDNIKKTTELVMNNIGVNPEIALKIEQTMNAPAVEINKTARSISMATKSEDVMLKDIMSAELKTALDQAELQQGPLSTEEKIAIVTKHIKEKSEKVITQIKSAKPEEVKQEMTAINKDMQVLGKLIKQAHPVLVKEVDSLVKEHELTAKKPMTAEKAEKVMEGFKKVIETACTEAESKGRPNKVLAQAAQNLEEAIGIIKKRETAEKSVETAQKIIKLLKRANPDISRIAEKLQTSNPTEVLSVLQLMVADGQIEDKQVLSSLSEMAEELSAVKGTGKELIRGNAKDLAKELAKATGQPQSTAQAQKTIENKIAAAETVEELDAIKTDMTGLEDNNAFLPPSILDTGLKQMTGEVLWDPTEMYRQMLLPGVDLDSWQAAAVKDLITMVDSAIKGTPWEGPSIMNYRAPVSAPEKSTIQEDWKQLYNNAESFGEKKDILSAQLTKMTEMLDKIHEERLEQEPLIDKKTLESQQVKDVTAPVVERKAAMASAAKKIAEMLNDKTLAPLVAKVLMAVKDRGIGQIISAINSENETEEANEIIVKLSTEMASLIKDIPAEDRTARQEALNKLKVIHKKTKIKQVEEITLETMAKLGIAPMVEADTKGIAQAPDSPRVQASSTVSAPSKSAAVGDIADVDTAGMEQQFENKFGRPPGRLEVLSMKVRAAAENVRDASAEMNKEEMLKNVKQLRKNTAMLLNHLGSKKDPATAKKVADIRAMLKSAKNGKEMLGILKEVSELVSNTETKENKGVAQSNIQKAGMAMKEAQQNIKLAGIAQKAIKLANNPAASSKEVSMFLKNKPGIAAKAVGFIVKAAQAQGGDNSGITNVLSQLENDPMMDAIAKDAIQKGIKQLQTAKAVQARAESGGQGKSPTASVLASIEGSSATQVQEREKTDNKKTEHKEKIKPEATSRPVKGV
ncbi:hypothetical protein ACFL57_03115 [Candidatus Margulisiibacteriota bacterium]